MANDTSEHDGQNPVDASEQPQPPQPKRGLARLLPRTLGGRIALAFLILPVLLVIGLSITFAGTRITPNYWKHNEQLLSDGNQEKISLMASQFEQDLAKAFSGSPEMATYHSETSAPPNASQTQPPRQATPTNNDYTWTRSTDSPNSPSTTHTTPTPVEDYIPNATHSAKPPQPDTSSPSRYPATEYRPQASQSPAQNQPEPTRTLHLPFNQINAWMNVRLRGFLANRNIQMPDWMHHPMMAGEAGQAVIAFEYKSDQYNQVVSLLFKPVFDQTNTRFRLELTGAKAGIVPIPIDTLQSYVSQKFPQMRGEMDRYLNRLNTQWFEATRPHPGNAMMNLRLVGIRVTNQGLDLALRSEPRR